MPEIFPVIALVSSEKISQSWHSLPNHERWYIRRRTVENSTRLLRNDRHVNLDLFVEVAAASSFLFFPFFPANQVNEKNEKGNRYVRQKRWQSTRVEVVDARVIFAEMKYE